MPRIKFTADPKLPRDLAHLGYRAGTEVDLSADQADRWLRRGVAVVVPAAEQPAPVDAPPAAMPSLPLDAAPADAPPAPMPSLPLDAAAEDAHVAATAAVRRGRARSA